MCLKVINAFFEKRKSVSGLINAGCYVLPKHALGDFSSGHPLYRNRVFIKYLRHVQYDGFIVLLCQMISRLREQGGYAWESCTVS